MDDDPRRERAREFSRRELLRVGWVLPVVASIAVACGDDGGDWTGLRAGSQSGRRSTHADADHIDSGTGADHADVAHADSESAPPGTSDGATTTTRRTGTTAHTDVPHEDVPVHWDTPHADEHTDVGGPDDPEHLDTPYGDHTDSSQGFEVHDDSPHVDELFQDEPLVDHEDVHNDVPHGDIVV
jgi:hypothetical protein